MTEEGAKRSGAKQAETSKTLLPRASLLTRTLLFIQSYDKIIQILVIAIPGLAFTYLYNQFEEASKQIEIINSVKTSLVSTNKQEQQIAFNTLMLLPNAPLVRRAFRALPLETRVQLVTDSLAAAIIENDSDAVHLVAVYFCDYIRKAEEDQRVLPFSVGPAVGNIIQLIRYYPDTLNSARIAGSLVKCGSPLFYDGLPPLPSLPGTAAIRWVQSNALSSAIESDNTTAVRIMIDAFMSLHQDGLSSLSTFLRNTEHFWYRSIALESFDAMSEFVMLMKDDRDICDYNPFGELVGWSDEYFRKVEGGYRHNEAHRFFDLTRRGPLVPCIQKMSASDRNKLAGEAAKFKDPITSHR